MKATLIFDLPEEAVEFEAANKGLEWKMVVSDLLDFLRYQRKHVDHSPDEYRAFEQVREHLVELMQERDLSVW